MKYEIRFDKRAIKFINKQPHDQKTRLFAAIYKLPYEGDIAPLQPFSITGQYRLRVGTYRVIFTKEDDVLIIRVLEVDNRGDVYKRH